MTTRNFTGVLAALIILITGCDNELMDHHQDAEEETYLAAKEDDQGPQTYDKILADIALEVPGYGGHFIDEEGVLNVWLLDERERHAVVSILRQYNAEGVLALNDNLFSDLKIRQGTYSFLQLYNWKAALRRDVLAMEGVTLLDINETENNITIGVEDLEQKEEILEKVRQAGIPEAAINIIERGAAELY